MRLVSTALAAMLVLPTPAALAQANRDACGMLDSGVLQNSLGTAPTVVEEHGAGTGVSLCHWSGGTGMGVRLHSITAASQNIVGGTPVEYFLQAQAYQSESIGAANLGVVDGPWQAGYLVDVVTEPNPERVYSLTFINKDDTVTLETYGLSKDVTVSLAEAVARAM